LHPSKGCARHSDATSLKTPQSSRGKIVPCPSPTIPATPRAWSRARNSCCRWCWDCWRGSARVAQPENALESSRENLMLPIKTKVCPTGFPPVSKTLPQAIKRLASALKPEKIILFGSYAYGSPTPDSDVDLLVVLRTRKPRKERVIAVSLLLYPRPFPVDIIVKTPGELSTALRKGDVFISEIVKKGVVLYERPN